MSRDWSERESALVQRRFDSVLAAARQNRTSVGLDSISELMPRQGPEGPTEVSEWLAAHPTVGQLVGDRVVAGPLPPQGESFERQVRGRRYLAEAERIVAGPISPVARLVRCVAVTGSAAYGEPSPQDDLDFLVITRPGSVWPFLLFSYLAARRHRPAPHADLPSHWCFNYVLDERAARGEFGAPRGFLFAREALMARPVVGEAYYRGLIRSAGWLEEEVPRLYLRWARDGLPPLPSEDPAPLGVRALNVILFPILAAYLTLATMVRNRRLSRSGSSEKRFRVEAHLDRLTYETGRFDELRSLYATSSVHVAPEGA